MAGKGRLAEQVRTRLEVVEKTAMSPKVVQQSLEVDPLDELWFNKPIRQHVREFAVLFGIIFFAAAGYFLYRGYSSSVAAWLAAAGFVITALGYRAPAALRPLWKGWMAFAEMLGIGANFVILFVAWLLMFIPVGIVMKFAGKYVMDLRYRADVESYWEDRDPKFDDFKRLERQY